LNWIYIELNWIQINNWIEIQLKKNGTQIGGEVIENLLVNMVLEKKTPLKRHKSQNTFICFFIWKINCNLELFNLWGFMKYKIILLKPTLTNHHNWNCFFFHFFQKSQLTVINTIKYIFHIGYNHSRKQMLVNLNLTSDNIHCFWYNYLSN